MNPKESTPDKRHTLQGCLVCNSARVYYLFSASDCRVVRCQDCGFAFLNPQPSDSELAEIYSHSYFLGSDSPEASQAVRQMKQATARLYLSEVNRYAGPQKGRLLEVGCGDGDFLVCADAEGWNVTGVEYSSSACDRARERVKNGEVVCGELKNANLPSEWFESCVLSDVIEHVRNPIEFLREVYRVLKPGGTLLIATPSMDSWSAKLMKQKWMEFKAEHLSYFDRQTMQTALSKAGFREVVVETGWKILSLEYIKMHFQRFPVPIFTPVVKWLVRLLPERMRLKHRRLVASGMMVLSRKDEKAPTQTVSVIVPAFNEAKTFPKLMQALLKKTLPGLNMEIVVVESNSTDGTRELAQQFIHEPSVKVIFEATPKGKGAAVRIGLGVATGDYVLIQDADLEYDLDDYDALLEPLIAGRAAFVLGSRHGGRNVWKMREFTGQRSLSLYLNFGHGIFAFLVNLLFLNRIRDPFTMFKVFRRDCLYGLDLKCNRFDFDFELLVKLIRKGYRPIELPVNYRSRSFSEGKKVRMFSDPFTWIKALAWLRFVKIDPIGFAEQARLKEAGRLQAASTSLGRTGTSPGRSALPI
jgi:glycosyltransferase involved in cell wall biosynthesis/2-polyprenyl-3-methyl-5-hydroxy-6-metoxy-1,4-benzoquinol methylase